MTKYLLYVALQDEGDAGTEFDSVDKVVEATSELIRNTFGTGRKLVTFSVGDITDYEENPMKEATDGES